MAKITVKDLDARVAADAAERDRLKAESREADTKKAELEKMATAAAESGRLEDYRALKRQAAAVEEEAFVRAAQIGRLSQNVPDADVIDAWGGYEAAYEKELAARLAEAEKRKDAFLDAYEAAINLQAEALAVRERLAGYLGKDVDASGLSMPFIPTTPMVPRPPVNDFTASFYLSQRKGKGKPGHLSVDPVTERVIAVVCNHRST